MPGHVTRAIRLEFRHLSQVTSLARLCFPRPWGEKDFAYFLAHEAGVGLGIFGMAPLASKDLAAYFLGLLVQGDLDVISVATHPELRRNGLAEELMREALQLSGVNRAFLEVDTTNQSAIELYRKLGFQSQRIRRGYYEGKRDALVMHWTR